VTGLLGFLRNEGKKWMDYDLTKVILKTLATGEA